MAGIKAKGIEGLQLSMQEVAALPESVVEKMLMAGGEIVVSAHKRQLASMGLVRTGTLQRSVASFAKKSDGGTSWSRSVVVYPKGTHHKVAGRKQTQKANGRKSKSATVPSSEVGFVLEYGAPKRHIKARKWMEKANETSADAVVAAEMQVYDAFLQSKEL